MRTRPSRSYWTLAEKVRTTTTEGAASRTFWRPAPELYGRHPSGLAAVRAHLEAIDPTIKGAPDATIRAMWRGRQGVARAARGHLKPMQCREIPVLNQQPAGQREESHAD